MTLTTVEIRDRYRAEVLAWAAAKDDSKKANRLFKEHHAFYKEIRGLPEGQQALESLLSDPEPPVRLLAATHLLRIEPARAEPVLRGLQADSGLYAVDAKYTLINFRTGKLNLDW